MQRYDNRHKRELAENRSLAKTHTRAHTQITRVQINIETDRKRSLKKCPENALYVQYTKRTYTVTDHSNMKQVAY